MAKPYRKVIDTGVLADCDEVLASQYAGHFTDPELMDHEKREEAARSKDQKRD